MTTEVLGEEITLGISFWKEFSMRYGVSYTAEKSTMHGISRHCVNSGDVDKEFRYNL